MEQLSIYLLTQDEHLKPILEERAKKNNRSLSAEIVTLVKKGLGMDEAPYVYEVEVERNES